MAAAASRSPRPIRKAQAFFDNGMQLAHAFAHKAAIEAMDEAVRLDPSCAMCLWGQAWASGPTINFGKSEDEVAKLAEIADKAAELAKANGTDRERALIHALQLRYKNGGGGKPGDLNFAKAMAGARQRISRRQGNRRHHRRRLADDARRHGRGVEAQRAAGHAAARRRA